jgi:hypothetical protein
VGSTSEMHGPLRVRERRVSLFDEETPCIREFHNPSLVASEQAKLMLCFEVGNLFAERRRRLIAICPRPAGSSALRPRQ